MKRNASSWSYDSRTVAVSAEATSANYDLGLAAEYGRLVATLAWNARVVSAPGPFLPALTLTTLALELSDVAATAAEQLIATAASAIDNTQNFYVDIVAGHRYVLTVRAPAGVDVAPTYALAWRVVAGDD